MVRGSLADAVDAAIVILESHYGPADPGAIADELDHRFAEFRDRALRNQVYEGYLFDPTWERSLVTLDHLVQRLVDDLLDGLEPGSVLGEYRVMTTAGRDEPHGGVTSLLGERGEILGAAGAMAPRYGTFFSTASLPDKLALVDRVDSLQRAKAHRMEQGGGRARQVAPGTVRPPVVRRAVDGEGLV